jgi:diaminohydroxyphosphoribosylaminopyrimidine deaminase/5-amino-6-(5-phosphoribosylamino)uracil reductase
MARALRLAERGLYTADPNPRVGCVIVRDGSVVGEGWHQVAGGPHAEIAALAAAGSRAAGATAYVNLEPCCHHGRTPPCTDALIAAGIVRVVAALTDPNPHVAGQGLMRLSAVGIATECGLMADAAAALNSGFLQRMRAGRPYVRIKLGMSLDGRIAMASGESQWITSAEARADVQRLRARSSAILTGIGTVLSDDPALTIRLPNLVRTPLRVILDSELRTPETARCLSPEGAVMIATGRTADCAPWTQDRDNLSIVTVPRAESSLDLAAVVGALAERAVNEVLVEAGPRLTGAILQAGLCDEVVLYVAPKLLGHAARAAFAMDGLQRLADGLVLQFIDVRRIGPDLKIIATPAG